jgi:hypothetical protein
MSEKVEILAKVIKEMHLTSEQLHDLIRKLDLLFWEETAKQEKELGK